MREVINKMWEVFIIILVVVGAFAIWFNIWNKKNPVGGAKKKNKQVQIYKPGEKRIETTPEEKEQTERILKQWKEKEEGRHDKKKDPDEGAIYDSNGKRIS